MPDFNDPYSPLTPVQTQSRIEALGSDLLGGLGYLGDVLDKTFGGRAIRGGLGLLSGGGDNARVSPSELLSFLPLSDTLGLTDIKNRVSGKQLLQNVGLIDKSDEEGFGLNDALGLGAELLTDPATFGSTLVPRLLARGARGASKGLAAATGIDPWAFGGRAIEAAKVPLKTLFYPPAQGATMRFGQGVAEDIYTPVRKAMAQEAYNDFAHTTGQYDKWEPLAADFIGPPRENPGLGDLMARRNAANPAAQAATEQALERITFQASKGSPEWEAAARASAREFGFTPEETDSIVNTAKDYAGRSRARGLGAEQSVGALSKEALDIPEYKLQAQATARAASAAADKASAAAAQDLAARTNEYQQIAASSTSPYALEAADVARQEAARKAMAADALATKMSIPIPEMGAKPTEYIPQRLASDDVRNPLEAINQKAELTGASKFQIAREEAYKGLGGADVINDLYRDPRFWGEGKHLQPLAKDFMGPPQQFEGLTELNAKNELTKMLSDSPLKPGGYTAGKMPAEWEGTAWGKTMWNGIKDQAETLQKKLAAATPDVRLKGLFSENVFQGFLERNLAAARTTGSGASMVEGVLRGLDPAVGVTKKVEDFQRAGEKYVTIPDFLEQGALTHVDEAGRPVAQTKIAKVLGLDTKAVTEMTKALQGYGISADAANDIRRIGAAWTIPGALQPVVKAIDGVTKWFKDFLTFPFPAFLLRNLGSGFFQQWRGDALSARAIGNTTELIRGGTLSEDVARKLYPNLNAAQASKEFRNEMIAQNVAFTKSGQFGEKVGEGGGYRAVRPGGMPTVGGTARPLLEDIGGFGKGYIPTAEGGLSGQIQSLYKPETNLLSLQGKLAGNTAEDLLRGSHYLEKRLQGLDPAAAKMEVMKYQIDYGDMTQFEKQIMKRLFPFYGFSRGNLPPILEDLVTKPAKLAGSIRATTGRDPNQFMPEWISEGSAINLGKGDTGLTRYLSGLGLNYEDEGMKALGNLLAGKGSRALQTLGGQASPLLKFPTEQALGTQLFSGRKLEDLRPSPVVAQAGDLLQGMGIDQPGTKTQQLLSEVFAGTPFSRFGTTFGKLTDDRKDTLAKLLNITTGAQLTDVDIPKTQLIAARDQLGPLMKASPNVRAFEEFYVPKEKLKDLTPQELDAYMTFRGIEAKAKEEAKKRKANLLANPLLP